MRQTLSANILVISASLLVLVTGCGPQLASQQSMELDPNDIRTVLIDPNSTAQTVKLTAVSDGAPVSVFVYLSEHEEEVDRAITFGTESEHLIANQTSGTSISISAAIPPDKEASVRIQCASPNPAVVQLTITN